MHTDNFQINNLRIKLYISPSIMMNPRDSKMTKSLQNHGL